jgi:hypothetical protein
MMIPCSALMTRIGGMKMSNITVRIKKEDVRQPRKTWAVRPIQKPHSAKGYKRVKKDWSDT